MGDPFASIYSIGCRVWLPIMQLQFIKTNVIPKKGGQGKQKKKKERKDWNRKVESLQPQLLDYLS